jgi:hypothetical protein
MGKRRIAATRRPLATAPVAAALAVPPAPLVHVSRESVDTPPTTIPPRPRTVGPRLQPARHGEYLLVPRRRA